MTTKIVQAVLALALFVSPLTVLPPGRAEARTLTIPAEQGLQGAIQSYISGLGATYGVSVVNLSDGRTVSVNDRGLFPTASLYKLLVMYRVFQAINRGNLSLNDRVTIRAADLAAGESAAGFSPGDAPTVGYALNRMITISSNAAAYALTRAVGGWYQVASAAGELGMYNTTLTDDFWSTPNDFAHFFRLLANRSLVSPAASDQMIDLLLAQQFNDRIPALLPGSSQVAHKTGEFPTVRNDAGIVWCPGARYVIVMMSRGGSPAEEVAAEARISRMVYDAFCG